MKSFIKKLQTGFLLVMIGTTLFIPASASAAKGLIVCGEDYNNDGVLRNYVDEAGNPVPEVCGFNDLIRLVNVAIDFMIFVILIPVATLLFMYAGLLYILTFADPKNKGKAKNIFQKVFKGLLWALLAWVIVKFFVLAFGGSDQTILWLLE